MMARIRLIAVVHWAKVREIIAQVYGLFPDRGLILEPARDLTRKEVAIAIYKILAVQ